jgi:acylphosphatase
MSGDGARRAVRVRIRGRVQGVWFRGWTCEEAIRHGLAGWVRNRRDGSVEALLVGSPAAVEAMIAACRSGPSHARVDDVTVEDAGAEADDVAGFDQRATL